MIHIDIAVLSSGIHFDDSSFFYTYSLQSISTTLANAWLFDAPALSTAIGEASWFLDDSSDLISATATEWTVGNGQFNEVSRVRLILYGLNRLKRIVIGDENFGEVRRFGLIGLSELESVVVGFGSFNATGFMRIMNCNSLSFIQFSDDSFSDYRSFELNGLPSLVSIEMGGFCFSSTRVLSIASSIVFFFNE